MSDDYDPAEDARKCYDVAIAAKRARGDTHYPVPFSQKMSAAEYRAMQAAPKRSKYGAKRYFTHGIWFDSIAEGRFYEGLMQRKGLGEIGAIMRQPEFPLLVNGVPVGKYRADFQFFDKTAGRERTVDVKGFDTPLSRWKRKHVKAQYGLDVEIVK